MQFCTCGLQLGDLSRINKHLDTKQGNQVTQEEIDKRLQTCKEFTAGIHSA